LERRDADAKKRPNFIALETPDPKTAYIMVMVGRTGAAHVFQQLEDSVFGDPRHADYGIDAAPFYEGGNHLDALCSRKPIHNK
jgi:hypothetical protein